MSALQALLADYWSQKAARKRAQADAIAHDLTRLGFRVPEVIEVARRIAADDAERAAYHARRARI